MDEATAMNWIRALPFEYFLLAHHDYRGDPLINLRVLSTGLAGAMIADLAIPSRVVVDADRVHLRDPQPHPADTPAHEVTLREIAAQPDPRTTRAWVEYLRQELYDRVAAQLVADGTMREETGGLVRRTRRYVATDPLAASHARVELRWQAEHGPRGTDQRTATLAALARATGLDKIIADGANRETMPGLAVMAATVRPDLAGVVAAVDKAVRAIVLVPNR
jgi:hypothetical protein